jgi:hypothetical protein
MIQRDAGSNLIIDWIGTDARVAHADPMILEIQGLPAGTYMWTSYHHDTQDQTGLFDVTVTDALGSETTTDIDISNGNIPFDQVTRFEIQIESNGFDPIILSFDNQGYSLVSEAFFVMNAFVLEDLHSPYIGPNSVESKPNAVVINEFLASNQEGLVDGDGNHSDWIELYNGTNETVSLDGWTLTDDVDEPAKWVFPADTVLPAHGYLVVFASGQSADDYIDSAGYLHTNFALNKEGEYLALLDASGVIVHEVAPNFPAQETDISYGLQQSEWYYFAQPTPGHLTNRPLWDLPGPRTVMSGDFMSSLLIW